MRQGGIVSAQFLFQRVERLLRSAFPRNDPKRPVGNFLAAGKPFVRPGKKNGSSKAAFYDAIDVPTEHLGLLVL
jgi:hypothetical protein